MIANERETIGAALNALLALPKEDSAWEKLGFSIYAEVISPGLVRIGDEAVGAAGAHPGAGHMAAE